MGVNMGVCAMQNDHNQAHLVQNRCVINYSPILYRGKAHKKDVRVHMLLRVLVPTAKFLFNLKQFMLSSAMNESTISPQAHRHLVLFYFFERVTRQKSKSALCSWLVMMLDHTVTQMSHKALEGQGRTRGQQGFICHPVWLIKSSWTKWLMEYKECILDKKHDLAWAWVSGRHCKTFLADVFFFFQGGLVIR